MTITSTPRLPFPYPLPLPALSGAELADHAWDEDELCMHGVGSLNGVGPPYMATIIDIRLRRWYRIVTHYEIPDFDTRLQEDVDSLLEDPHWLQVLQSTGHRGRDDFNQIDVPSDGKPLTYRLNPLNHSGTPMYGLQPPPSASVPSVLCHELRDRQYLFRSTEKCSCRDWEGVGPWRSHTLPPRACSTVSVEVAAFFQC
ncbi:hypothetical protein BDP27DRAFT_1326456 [Rhodocollybia butyracea]|uniref:Uncharacterized protein n=1 Tax=Rhodocollybia butyracea TaxID=206335 RepID=A0A9P5PRV8_9AGAR|nr:hypothetical protein BDP27DRAFT_1326456 [Rhodocollybia butyracea]